MALTALWYEGRRGGLVVLPHPDPSLPLVVVVLAARVAAEGVAVAAPEVHRVLGDDVRGAQHDPEGVEMAEMSREKAGQVEKALRMLFPKTTPKKK